MYNEINQHNYLVCWQEGKVICARYKENVIVELEAAKEIVSFRRKIYPGRHLNLVIIDNIECITPEARKYFALPHSCNDIIKGPFLLRIPF